MIPTITEITVDFAESEHPSKTYNMNTSNETICGNTDELQAVKQAIFKLLQTERYESPIYSGNYGVELADLFGQPLSYVQPELERRICEALLQDERIQSVTDFQFTAVGKGELLAEFKVTTVFGEVTTERKVNI